MPIDRDRALRPIRNLRKLVRNLDSQPAPGKVHKLRTNTRRVEALCEALSLSAQGIRKSVMKDLRRCRKRAGKVRDMDVLIRHASTVQVPGEEECAARLLEHLGAQRRKYARKLYAEVRPLRSGLRKELKHVADVVGELIPATGNRADENAAGPTGTAATLAVHLADPHRLNRGNLHPYRLKVKKLRNVLQIGAADTAFAHDLDKAKDAIGEWHDWEELVSIAQKELDHANPCRLVAELKRISRDKYDRGLAVAQSLRATYLRGSDSATPRLPVWDAIAKLAG
jgi:CHAD domain-containing protein